MNKTLQLLAIVLGTAMLSGCGGVRFMEPGARLATPPAGKALVNFHRPSKQYGGSEYIVWDKQQVIGNAQGGMSFQYVCDPGSHVFIGRQCHVSVIKAELAPNKIYDLAIDVYPNFVPFQADHRIQLSLPDEKRRAEIPVWEANRESPMQLAPSQEADRKKYEERERKKIDEILKDFLEGDKKDRVGILTAETCRK